MPVANTVVYFKSQSGYLEKLYTGCIKQSKAFKEQYIKKYVKFLSIELTVIIIQEYYTKSCDLTFFFSFRSLLLMAIIVGTSYYLDHGQSINIQPTIVPAADTLLKLSWPLRGQYIYTQIHTLLHYRMKKITVSRMTSNRVQKTIFFSFLVFV